LRKSRSDTVSIIPLTLSIVEYELEEKQQALLCAPSVFARENRLTQRRKGAKVLSHSIRRAFSFNVLALPP
jgi:hypothetical protein